MIEASKEVFKHTYYLRVHAYVKWLKGALVHASWRRLYLYISPLHRTLVLPWIRSTKYLGIVASKHGDFNS